MSIKYVTMFVLDILVSFCVIVQDFQIPWVQRELCTRVKLLKQELKMLIKSIGRNVFGFVWLLLIKQGPALINYSTCVYTVYRYSAIARLSPLTLLREMMYMDLELMCYWSTLPVDPPSRFKYFTLCLNWLCVDFYTRTI